MDIDAVKHLSAPASRLLNVLLLLGGEAGNTPTKVLMELAGIPDSGNFSRAKKRLEDAGLVVAARPGTYRFSSATFSSASSAVGSLPSPTPDIDGIRSDQILSILSEPKLKWLLERAGEEVAVTTTDPPSVTTTGETVEATASTVTTTGDCQENSSPVTTTETPVMVTEVPVTTTAEPELYERCLDADDMDGSGPETSRKSPFYAKRQVQIGLVQEIWKKFFPNAPYISGQYARDYLAMCDNKVSVLYEGVETTKNRAKGGVKSPIKYINTALPDWLSDRPSAQAPRPQASRPAATASPARRGGDEWITKGAAITADELTPVSDEQRREMKEYAERYASLFE